MICDVIETRSVMSDEKENACLILSLQRVNG